MSTATPETPAAADLSPAPGERMDRRLVVLLAVTCGVAVTNLYVAQPLLDTIARAFGVGESTAGLLVTAGQVGYVLGLAFLVPLGDLLERRRLVVGLLVIAAAAQVVSTVAPSFAVLAASLAAVGVASAVAQVVVPLASSMAGEEERGDQHRRRHLVEDRADFGNQLADIDDRDRREGAEQRPGQRRLPLGVAADRRGKIVRRAGQRRWREHHDVIEAHRVPVDFA